MFTQTWPQLPQLKLSEPRFAQGASSEQHTDPGPHADPVHTPAWHESELVQALPSSQLVPSALGRATHWPLAGLQSCTSWRHWGGKKRVGQMMPEPLTQLPAWQASPTVHPLPSLHVVPLAFAGYEH